MPRQPSRKCAVFINLEHFIINRQSPLLEVRASCRYVAAKTNLAISRLPSAAESAPSLMPGPPAARLNTGAHEKGLPQIDDLRKPDTPLKHPRPGYPLSSCVPAELDSVSPGDAESTECLLLPQPLNTRAIPQKIPGGLGDWWKRRLTSRRCTEFERQLSHRPLANHLRRRQHLPSRTFLPLSDVPSNREAWHALLVIAAHLVKLSPAQGKYESKDSCQENFDDSNEYITTAVTKAGGLGWSR